MLQTTFQFPSNSSTKAKRKKIQFWFGFHFGMLRTWDPFCHGVVVTPRYVEDLIRTKWRGALIIDNGAFPAWVKKEELSLETQISTMMKAAIDLLKSGFSIRAFILPDVIGNGSESRIRHEKALQVMKEKFPKIDCWAVAQEGTNFKWCADFADGVFVGGASLPAKRQMIQLLQKHSPKWLHAGRQAQEHDLIFCNANGVDSVDSTTPTKWISSNAKKDWYGIFQRQCDVFINQAFGRFFFNHKQDRSFLKTRSLELNDLSKMDFDSVFIDAHCWHVSLPFWAHALYEICGDVTVAITSRISLLLFAPIKKHIYFAVDNGKLVFRRNFQRYLTSLDFLLFPNSMLEKEGFSQINKLQLPKNIKTGIHYYDNITS